MDAKEQKMISYTEFIAATLDQRVYLTEEKLWGLFQYFDSVTNNGFITVSDIKEIFNRHGKDVSEE